MFRIRHRQAHQIRLEVAPRQFHQRRISPSKNGCPLSLQDLCFLRVINDVEYYPVWMLASLPLWLCYQLLSSLPVLDLCHLDCSPIARGVDMNEIWINKLINEPNKRPSIPHQPSHPVRPSFIERLFQMTVYQSNTDNYTVPRIARLKRDMEEAFRASIYSSKRIKFTNKKEEYLITLAVNVLSCSDASAVAHKLVSIRGGLLSQRLGITEKNVWNNQPIPLALSDPGGPKTYNPMTRVHKDTYLTPHHLSSICESADLIEFLSLLVYMCKIRPTSISLDVDMLSQPILDNLQAEKIALDSGLVVPREQVSCFSIMKCLMENTVVLRVESLKCAHITGPMIALIEAAKGNGKLKSLFCSIPSLHTEIVQTFCDFFPIETFYRLHLEIGDFSPQAIIQLLQAFMTSPCRLAQKLVIRASESARQTPFLVKQQVGSFDVGDAIISECALRHKVLEIYPENYLLEFLLLLPCIRLTEVELNCSSGTTPIFHLCACHPNLQVKRLVLNLAQRDNASENKLLKATIENDLLILISNPALRELYITGNWEGFPEAKQGLLQGLQQQRQPDLKLRDVYLDMAGYSDKDVRALLEVVASFPLHYQPRVKRRRTFIDAAKANGFTYDRVYSISSWGLVSRKQ